MKELDFELVAPSLLQHKVITATEYGALSRLPGEEQVGSYFFFIAPQSFSGGGLVFKLKLVTMERV